MGKQIVKDRTPNGVKWIFSQKSNLARIDEQTEASEWARELQNYVSLNFFGREIKNLIDLARIDVEQTRPETSNFKIATTVKMLS